jgi:cation diffusion facilitator family transporter
MSAGTSLKVIFGSLAANLGIAIAKAVAGVMTGSGSMIAEAIHSSADCMNQILLLVGAKQAAQPPDVSHPLGYGRSAYFWSFLVALMIFLGGGVFSIQEGIHKLSHPEPVKKVWVGFAVLGVALILEGLAAIQAAVEINKQRKGSNISFVGYLSKTTDVDLVVLFAENAAAVIGLIMAMGSLFAAWKIDPKWDGVGSIGIGVLLTLVAFFLAKEVKSLLDGERADPTIEKVFKEEIDNDNNLELALRIITVQQGPSQVMLAAKIRPKNGISALELIESINRLEVRVKTRCPEVLWQFIEPDITDT